MWASYAREQLVTWREYLDVYVIGRWGALGITAATVPASRVLDVCCGRALPTLALVATDPAASLIGID
jgi:ubiquinone/menaquinone biosynthesis C-methylase UbiE